MKKLIKILSIDGGGIRGIIPAVVLAELERQTGKPIASLFDLVAGTSTGGIIALGLVKPDERGRPEHTAANLVRLYEEHGEDIFPQYAFQAIQTVRSLFEEKYDAGPLEAVLKRYFGAAHLKDSITPVIITSYEIERRLAFFFKSRHAKSKNGYDFLMRDVARATSAAPTYFEPVKIKTPDISDYFALIDGGVYANNPAMCAYVEAHTMWPEASDYLLVSLGTGELTKPIPYDDAKGWGLTNWSRPILNVVFDGINDTVDYQLDKLLAPYNGFRRYYRFQARLDEDSEALDNVETQNIRNLKLIGEDIVRQNSHLFRLLIDQLLT